ncbi:hypothetical protein HII31_00100 [Pseudocercospora fuligena]|uniref:DUF6536 domain-containing protein n=1 Tax=Pseudocercospora fuligena TaxID=685502 RepID=A0A8H6RTZ2_9PEZI|nr:hypothetical protein HII31_00100 [Pseudocercospora fuligena]
MSATGGPSSRYHKVDESYDGHEYGNELEELDLTEIPPERAPSYTSIDANTFWDGVDDDKKGLVAHQRALSLGLDPKNSIDSDAPLRADTRLSVTSTLRSTKKRKLSGWHFGVRVCAWTATCVGLMNTILLIAGAAKFPVHDGIGVAYEGSCDVVDHWTTWLHILINALSSLLLSASNYTMQALAAPTRAEVDRAHAKGDWMDIGVASVRNLSRIKWLRIVLWWVLAVSSVPIHLLYNSAVFKTIDSNEYVIATVNPEWLKGGNFSTMIPWVDTPSDVQPGDYGYYVEMPYDTSLLPSLQKWWSQNYKNETLVQRLNNTDCINAYGTNFVTGRNHVLTITSETGDQAKNETLFMQEDTTSYYSQLRYTWMCQDNYNSSNTYQMKCDTSKIKKDPENWIINGRKIDYCLSQITPSHCELQFSVQILVAVIVMNIMKSIAMFVTLYKQKDATLVTIGDAVASYLDEPDDLTKGRCLMSRKDIKNWKLPNEKKPNMDPMPVTSYPPKTTWFFRAASKARWITAFTLIIVAIITTGSLLGMGMTQLEGYGASPFHIGFGSIDSRALISSGLPESGANGLISSILLANLPQAIVSFLYLLYNSLLTSMLLAKEWSSYALRRKPLRVTHPHGQQRSTYYLQLPLRYSAPLLIISATLHWMISQSIFLARINTYYDGKPTETDDISSVGYSCPPILVAMLIGIVLLFVALAMGFRKFRSPIPIASSCSVAIAAACHRPNDDPDAAYLPVQWGEVEAEGSDETGHCSFTSGPVEPLVNGRMYAGSGIRKRQSGTDDRGHDR